MSNSTLAEPLDTTTEVETPEHVRFRHHIAGPARRALAYLIDLIVRAIAVALIVVLASAGGLLGGISMESSQLAAASQGVILLVMFIAEWGYFVFFETLWSGRTPGKRALHLRVVTQGGHPLHFVDSLLRNLLRVADFLPAAYALGALVMGRDPRFRRLGDMVAGTMVIAERRHQVSGFLQIQPPPSEHELRLLPERPPLNGDELDAIELLLRRGGRLSPTREQELAQMIAPLYAQRLGLSAPQNPLRFLAVLYARARSRAR